MQRCRNHKMRNVIGYLPEELHDHARALMRATWWLGAKDGKAWIEPFASWVKKQHPDAAGSLREGLDELFTVSELGLPLALLRCLGTTNVIDNAHSDVRRHTDRIHGGPVGHHLIHGGREAVPKDHGLPHPMDTQCPPRRARPSPSDAKGGHAASMYHPGATAPSNCCRDTFLAVTSAL